MVTKTDLAEPGVIRALAAELARLNPTAPILDARADALAADDLMASDVYDPAKKPAEVAHWLRREVEQRLRLRRIAATTGHGTDVTSTPFA